MTHLFDTIISNHKNKYVQRNETENLEQIKKNRGPQTPQLRVA